MHCDPQTVRTLAANVKRDIALAEIESFASGVDAEIDAKLAPAFFWPSDASGALITPTPGLIQTIANKLTAAAIEMTKYAVSEAGQATPNPYAMSLRKEGRDLLTAVVSGAAVVPGLQARQTPSASTGAAPAVVAARSGRRTY